MSAVSYVQTHYHLNSVLYQTFPAFSSFVFAVLLFCFEFLSLTRDDLCDYGLEVASGTSLVTQLMTITALSQKPAVADSLVADQSCVGTLQAATATVRSLLHWLWSRGPHFANLPPTPSCQDWRLLRHLTTVAAMCPPTQESLKRLFARLWKHHEVGCA